MVIYIWQFNLIYLSYSTPLFSYFFSVISGTPTFLIIQARDFVDTFYFSVTFSHFLQLFTKLYDFFLHVIAQFALSSLLSIYVETFLL